jgi:hypothetical protein
MPWKGNADKKESNERNDRERGIGGTGHIGVWGSRIGWYRVPPSPGAKENEMNNIFLSEEFLSRAVALCYGALVKYLEVALFFRRGHSESSEWMSV